MTIDPNFDFFMETEKMYLATRFLCTLDLKQIIEVVDLAHAIGPMIDPTKYRNQLQTGHMDDAAKMARLFLEPVKYHNEVVLPKMVSMGNV